MSAKRALLKRAAPNGERLRRLFHHLTLTLSWKERGLWVTAAVAAMAFAPRPAFASCDQIPGAVDSFRSTLGEVDRPFAGPGDYVRVNLTNQCATSTGFLETADQHVVSVAFQPRNGARNLVILAADCSAVEASSCGARDDIASASCINSEESIELIASGAQGSLRFRFPDTDALLPPGDDGRTFTGPAAIAITAADAALPCDLASKRCSELDGTIACVDRLYAATSVCGEAAHELFPQFTALPPPNDFRSLCNTIGSECTGSAGEVHMTVDADGNLLLPMDWSGILLGERVPFARLVRASSSIEAFPGSGMPIRLPSENFLQSVSLNGGLLPALFEPQLDPSGAAELSLFGAADAPRTVLRFGRRGGSRRSCDGGSNDHYPCITATDCPDGTCGESTCADDPGETCDGDADCPGECGPSYFDFSTRLFQDVGPVVIARRGPGVCEDDGTPCTDDASCDGSLCVRYRLSTEDPVLVDGVFESETLRVSVTPEGIAGRDLNGDGDLSDEVVLLSDRETGRALPIGFGTVGQRPLGRAATLVRQGAFRDAGLALSGDFLAFLEAEPLQWGRDLNGDGDQADSFLRVFRRDREVTARQNVNVDAAPMIDGKPLAFVGDLVLVRSRESADARHEIVRVSTTPSGQAANGRSGSPHVSRDGRWIAFESSASDLVDAPSQHAQRVFVYDVQTDTTTEIVPSMDDLIDPSGPVRSPWLSADGRYVALNAPDQSGLMQVWIYDRDTDADGIFDEPGATRTDFGSISQNHLRLPRGESLFPALNADGRILSFVGRARDLRLEGDDRLWLTYWHDRDPDGNGIPTEPGKYSTNLVSILPDGREPNLHSVFQPAPISDDGDAYAFASFARDLVDGDTNELCLNLFPDDQSSGNCSDVFLFSYWHSPTQRISVGNQGQQANQASLTPAMSADGGLVAFLSFASNLVPGDTNGVADVFLRDVHKRSTVRISVAPTGEEADGSSFGASLSMSADGRYIAFASSAGNLVDGDDNLVCDNDLDGNGGENCFDAFVHDRFSGFTQRISATGADHDGNERSTRPSISGDGVIVAFQSRASNLAANDDNRRCDNDLDGENDDNCGDVFVARPHPGDIVRADLSGDGDLDDTVLRTFDVSSGELRTLCPAADVVTAGGLVVFLRPEKAGRADGCPVGDELPHGVDLNGDGDADDLVVHRWRSGGAVENLRLAASAIAASEQWIAALRPDPLRVRGRDFGNDNGPVRHLLLHSATADAGDWIDPDQLADIVEVSGDIVAFTFPEDTYSPDFRAPPPENDLTGNSSQLPPDRVPFLYHAGSGRRVAFKSPLLGEYHLAATDFVLGSRLFAFVSDETAQNGRFEVNCDFSLDGDCGDLTLFVYDIERDILHDTQQTIVSCPIELCDPSLPFVVLDHTVRFLTLESEQGEDLNGDGDLDDLVVQTFNADAAATSVDEDGGSGAQKGARPGLRVIGPIEAGACTDTRAACVDSTDCPAGECQVPPGRCALPTSIACDPVSGRDECGQDAFCVPGIAGTGSCRLKQGSCFEDSDCNAPARCIDRGGTARRFLNPLRAGGDGALVFSSAGECVEDLGVACSVGGTRCANGATCEPPQPGMLDGACRRFLGSCATDDDCPGNAFCRPSLVLTSAADSDGDEVPDAFDNCDDDVNPDQADGDGDGVGDVCQRQVVVDEVNGKSSSGGCAMTGNESGGLCLLLLIAIIFQASSPFRRGLR